MSDLEFLYAVFIAFYLWECSHWLRLDTVSFVSWMGGGFGRAKAFFVVNSRESGLVFSSPLPVGGTFFFSSEWPLAVSPSGVSNAAGLTALFANDPRFTTQRRRVRVDDRTLATASSPAQARWLARQLDRLTNYRLPTERERHLRTLLSGTFDSETIASSVAQFDRMTRSSDATALLLFGFVFAIAPLIIWRTGIGWAWPWLLGGLTLLCGVNALVFHRVHRKLYPDLADERFSHLVMVLLFPPIGMRTRDLLSCPMLETFHPIALAGELCRSEPFAKLAEEAVRDLRFPRPTARDSTGATAEIWSWYRSVLGSEVETLISRKGLQPDRLAAAPTASDADCQSYCPRCHAQFTRSEGHCSDCDVTLVPFGQRDPSAL